LNHWKAIVGFCVLAAVLWWLYPERPAARKDPRVVEISFLGPAYVHRGNFDVLLREFETWSEEAHARDPNHPIYRVVFGLNPSLDPGGDPTRFLVSVAGGEPPDVMWFGRAFMHEWAARGAFEPLDEYIERDLESARRGEGSDLGLGDIPSADRFYPACWQAAMYGGKSYGIPIDTDVRLLFYNEDLLIAAGYRRTGPDGRVRARPPRTWDELREYTARLTRRDQDGQLRVVGFPPSYGQGLLCTWAWLNGGRFISADGTRCTLNEPAVVDAMRFAKELYDLQGGYDEVRRFQAGFQHGETALDPFIQGKMAMKFDGIWALFRLASHAPDMNFGVAPFAMPRERMDELAAGGKEPMLTWSGGWAYTIPYNARHKEGAWALIRFLSSDRASRLHVESLQSAAESQGRLFLPGQSAVKALNEEFYEAYVLTNPRLPPRFKEGYKICNDLLPRARFRPLTPVGMFLRNAQHQCLEDVLQGGRDPQESADYQTARVQLELDKVLHPAEGRPIRDWTWFFVLYALILVAVAGVAVLWDTRPGFRLGLAGVLRLSRRRAENVIVGSRGGYMRRQWFGGLVCAAPWIVGFVLLAGGPMLFSLIMSLCDYDAIGPARYIGLHNYREMFTRDELFFRSLGNTAFMMLGVPLGMALSLMIAVLLNCRVRGIALWRTLYYLPSIVPMVAASILWIWIFNPNDGVLNQALEFIGLQGPSWLQDTVWAKPAIILMGLWGAGGGMIIWLAGLKSINPQLYEAAGVDGANAFQRFWHVTIPQLTPYIFFNLVMGIIATFQIFGQAFIMTGGGPANSTLFYVYHLFNNAFRYGHMGYAAAMAWVLFAIVFTLTLVQMKTAKRWVYYESE